MKIKKLLILRPQIEEVTDQEGNIIMHKYHYPKSYEPEHACHICYNFENDKGLKGGHLAEGLVIYEAEEEDIKALLKEEGVNEISYTDADVKGKGWKPEKSDPATGGIEKEFDIKDWVEDEVEISKKVL